MRTEVAFTYADCFACAITKAYGTRVRFAKRAVKGGAVEEEVELYNADRDKLDRTLEYLSTYPHLSKFTVLERSRSGEMAKVVISTREGECPISLVVRGYSVGSKLPSMERVDFDGRIHWRLETKGSRKLERLERSLEAQFGVKDFSAKRRAERPSLSKSRFLLKEAYERGYFEVPKGLSMEELSQKLCVPMSTLDIDIRRALRNLLSESTC